MKTQSIQEKIAACVLHAANAGSDNEYYRESKYEIYDVPYQELKAFAESINRELKYSDVFEAAIICIVEDKAIIHLHSVIIKFKTTTIIEEIPADVS